MTACRHITLELLPVRHRTLRCGHCHLTIDGDELGDGCCPECFDRSGERNYEFEEVENRASAEASYRCEECGMILKAPG
jgi:hypothetical protein